MPDPDQQPETGDPPASPAPGPEIDPPSIPDEDPPLNPPPPGEWRPYD